MGTGSLYDMDQQRLPERMPGEHLLMMSTGGHPDTNHQLDDREPLSERLHPSEDMTFMAHMHRHLGGPALMSALDHVDHHPYRDQSSIGDPSPNRHHLVSIIGCTCFTYSMMGR